MRQNIGLYTICAHDTYELYESHIIGIVQAQLVSESKKNIDYYYDCI